MNKKREEEHQGGLGRLIPNSKRKLNLRIFAYVNTLEKQDFLFYAKFQKTSSFDFAHKYSFTLQKLFPIYNFKTLLIYNITAISTFSV